jgi:hypothetical protein
MILRASWLRGVTLVAADVAALVAFVPDGPALLHHLATADSWVAAVGADRAAASVVGAALWLCAVWLGFAIALIALAGAPGWLGATGRRLTQLVVPAAALRLIAGIAGVSISLGVIVPAAAVARPAAAAMSSVTTPNSVVTTNSSATPTWPTTPTTPTTPTPPTPPTTPTTPTTPAAPGWPTSSPGPLHPPGSAGTPHLVVAGDCLWNLAAAQLGPPARAPQVAAQVQAWYAANRAVIGPDPALLHPGQLLVQPGGTP